MKSYNSKTHVIRTNFKTSWRFELHEFNCKAKNWWVQISSILMATHGSFKGTKFLWISEADFWFEAHYISEKNSEENQNEFPLAAETVLKSTYMDDSMNSMVNEDEAMKLIQQWKDLRRKVERHPTKWLSNSKKVLREIDLKNRANWFKHRLLTFRENIGSSMVSFIRSVFF